MNLLERVKKWKSSIFHVLSYGLLSEGIAKKYLFKKNICENFVKMKTVDYEPRPLTKVKIPGTDASAVHTGSLLS